MANASIAVAQTNAVDDGEFDLQWQASRARTFAAAPSRRKPRPAGERKQLSCDLAQPSAEDWKNQEPEVIAKYYAQTYQDFFAIVDDYLTQANSAVSLYRLSSLSHRRWRFWIIVATGTLAAINVCAALAVLKAPLWGDISPSVILTTVAALYAAGLTVAGNIEHFLNRGEQAAGFREARDVLLSQYREFSSAWLNYVEAYGKTPTACVNAGRLYCQLVVSDQELRRKIKQLTEPQVKPGGKQSTGGHR